MICCWRQKKKVKRKTGWNLNTKIFSWSWLFRERTNKASPSGILERIPRPSHASCSDVPFCFGGRRCLKLKSCLSTVLENKAIRHVCTIVYIVYLQIMLVTCINLSDSRPIIQSATLAISYGQKCFLWQEQPCLPNLITVFRAHLT